MKIDRGLILVLLPAVFLIFIHLHSISLWSPDEPREASISRHILHTGDYIVPIFNGKPLPWKPLLFHWCVLIPSVLAGDVNEFTARLPSAFSAIGLLILLYYFISRFLTARTAFYSCLVLLTCYAFVEQARLSTIDMLLTFLMFCALVFFYQGYRFPEKRKRYYLFFYLLCGLAVLAKGPVGIVLPGMIVFFFYLSEKKIKQLSELFCPAGIFAFLFSVLPWYLAVCFQGGEGFTYEFLIRQNFIRYLNAFDHVQPFYYYLQKIPSHFFPWSIFFPGALVFFMKDFFHRKKEIPADSSLRRFILIWLITVFLFFSLSKSKRSQYILLLYPVMSLMIGAFWNRFHEEKRENQGFSPLWIRIPAELFVLGAGFVLLLFPYVTTSFPGFDGSYYRVNFVWSLILTGFVIYVAAALFEKKPCLLGRKIFTRIFMFTLAGLVFMVTSLYPQFDSVRSAVYDAVSISKTVGKAEMISYDFERPEFVFYLNRDSWKCFEPEERNEFLSYLKQHDVYCLIPRYRYEEVKAELNKMKTVSIVLKNIYGWKYNCLLLSNRLPGRAD
ncbi:MAG: glycosyltransferase family 39 protein [Candidatus Aureabacteria bacterium]|nr:glycosyltransferase family 39 protein [Candidatus Auribacterota bacterium]